MAAGSCSFGDRWTTALALLHGQAERVRCSAAQIPAAPPGDDSGALEAMLDRHAGVLMDYAVLLNCLRAMLCERALLPDRETKPDGQTQRSMPPRRTGLAEPAPAAQGRSVSHREPLSYPILSWPKSC